MKTNSQKQDTSYFVITGGSCAGKSTVIELIQDSGLAIIKESAREVIKRESKKGSDVLPWINREKFQQAVFEHQLKLEKEVKNEHVFCDRGIVDCLVYCNFYGIKEPEGIRELAKKRYKKVFVLDRLFEYKNDDCRKEDEEESKKIHDAIINTYQAFDYELIFIEALRPKERVLKILSSL